MALQSTRAASLPNTLAEVTLPMESAAQRTGQRLPPVLRFFLLGTVLLSVLCSTAEYAAKHYFKLDRCPYNCVTLVASDDYADASMFDQRFQHFHQANFFSKKWGSPFLYPAPDGFFYEAFQFSAIPSNWLLGTIAFTWLALGICLFTILRRRLNGLAAFVFALVATVFSYPLLFEFNRGNVEIFVWGLSAFGIWAFFKDRPWLAATLIAMAGACKGYPFLYLGLLFAKKQYRQVVYSLCVGVAINLFSLWAIADSFAEGRRGIAAGLDLFRTLYVLRWNAIGLDHSIFGLMKRMWTPFPSPESLAHILTAYMVIATAVACAAYLYLLRAKLPPINQLLFLSIACITLPPTSYDYTLLHLYSGWLLMVLLAITAWKRGLSMPPGLWAAFVCFALLLSPQNEIILHGERLEGQIKCVTLLALAVIALRYPFATSPALTATEA